LPLLLVLFFPYGEGGVARAEHRSEYPLSKMQMKRGRKERKESCGYLQGERGSQYLSAPQTCIARKRKFLRLPRHHLVRKERGITIKKKGLRLILMVSVLLLASGFGR